MAEEALTVDEAASRLKVMPKTVRGWLREGILPGVKIGRQWRVAESTLDAIIRGEIALADRDSLRLSRSDSPGRNGFSSD